MFGVSAINDHREKHFSNAAKRFALDAKMLRCRAAIHVENKDDVVFWQHVLRYFCPQDKFYFISGSRNEHGHETFGVTQCLKYYPYLNPNFLICIDSDYRYLFQEEGIDVQNFVLQTYTYSFENHLCFAEGLSDICSRVTHSNMRVFNFSVFFKEFSNILYDLFIWHLYFRKMKSNVMGQTELHSFFDMTHVKMHTFVRDNGKRMLRELKQRARWKLNCLEREYPQVPLEKFKRKFLTQGLTPDNVYLYVRGHNLYDMVSLICKEVCKTILRSEKRNREVTQAMIRELYRNRNNLDAQLRQNICFGRYVLILKIEEDINRLFGVR